MGMTRSTRTAHTLAAATISAANYLASSTPLDFSTNSPHGALLEVVVQTTAAPSGNKRARVFVQGSLDGVAYESGPFSGSTTTDEPDLRELGVIPINSSGVDHRRVFNLADAYGGLLPRNVRIVILNDAGVTITSVSAFVSEVTIS